MESIHVFHKPVIRYSIVSKNHDLSDSHVITRKKILQKYQILAKLTAVVCVGSVFENGVRPRDLSEMLGIPQATVRKFLREYVSEGVVKVNVVSGCFSLYRPV